MNAPNVSEEFWRICDEVNRDTTSAFISFEGCRPHYQRVLDYIKAHPEERNSIAKAFCLWLVSDKRATCINIYLLQFLMEVLRWPQVREAAEQAADKAGGSNWYF